MIGSPVVASIGCHLTPLISHTAAKLPIVITIPTSTPHTNCRDGSPLLVVIYSCQFGAIAPSVKPSGTIPGR